MKEILRMILRTVFLLSIFIYNLQYMDTNYMTCNLFSTVTKRKSLNMHCLLYWHKGDLKMDCQEKTLESKKLWRELNFILYFYMNLLMVYSSRWFKYDHEISVQPLGHVKTSRNANSLDCLLAFKQLY